MGLAYAKLAARASYSSLLMADREISVEYTIICNFEKKRQSERRYASNERLHTVYIRSEVHSGINEVTSMNSPLLCIYLYMYMYSNNTQSRLYFRATAERSFYVEIFFSSYRTEIKIYVCTVRSRFSVSRYVRPCINGGASLFSLLHTDDAEI